MPIKIPKGFPRRKTSGNALEELVNPPEPSFRVLERPGSKSFDGQGSLKRLSQARPSSVDDNIFKDGRSHPSPILSNRGSGGTHNSSSSGGICDTSSSSARFSSSSTLPSLPDGSPDKTSLEKPKTPCNLPISPIPESHPAFSLRAASKTFSFGRKTTPSTSTSGSAARSSIVYTEPHDNGHAIREPAGRITTRERALTASSYASGSTATPPRLLDTDLNFEEDLDGFGDMFEGLDKKRNQTPAEQGGFGTMKTTSPKTMSPAASIIPERFPLGEHSPHRPPSIHVDHYREGDFSTYPWGGRGSRDNLMSSSSPHKEQAAFPYHGNLPRAPQHSKGLTTSQPSPVPHVATSLSHALPEKPLPPGGSSLRRKSLYSSPRAATPLEDEDARLVMDSVSASRRLNRRSGASATSPQPLLDNPYDEDDDGDVSNYRLPFNNSSNPPYTALRGDSPQQNVVTREPQRSPGGSSDIDYEDLPSNLNWTLGSTETTPRPKKFDMARQDEHSLFDPPLPPTRKAAHQLERECSPTKKSSQTKVMTPAQFEKYRKEQEMSNLKSSAVSSEPSDDGSENGDDDDEEERNKQLAIQRRKQEAHLAVYRQQMMKVTGEQPSDLPSNANSRPTLDRAAMSSPNLSNRVSTNFNLNTEKPTQQGKTSDDEDEDVPLGILAAHGFPTKNRPPGSSTPGSSSHIRYTSETYPPPPASVAGGSTIGGPRGNLPPFAKNLPQDPYFGAGLVNPSNRESLSFGNSNTGSVYGGSQPKLPPGGLVGVIAGEEHARALRRGSPNASGGYSSPMPNGHMPQMPMGVMGMPPGVPIMSPGEEAQLQMSQQMTQMMQMQMQWMQQMMALQNGQSGQQLQENHQQQMMSNGFLPPPQQLQRPISMMGSPAPATPGLLQVNQRSMSMMDPSMASQWSQIGNRASMGPTMMSGALPTPGYTPSIAPSERSNVGMPTRYRPVSVAAADEHMNKSSRASTFTVGTSQGWSQKQGTASATVKMVNPPSRKKGTNVSDDDDEKGWEEMKKKREKKKSTWKLKRTGV